MNIGDKTWFKGKEITIASEPYELYGAMFQDAVTDDACVITIKAEGYKPEDNKMPQTIQIHDVEQLKMRNVTSNGKTITLFTFERSDILNPVIIECAMAEKVKFEPVTQDHYPPDTDNI